MCLWLQPSSLLCLGSCLAFGFRCKFYLFQVMYVADAFKTTDGHFDRDVPITQCCTSQAGAYSPLRHSVTVLALDKTKQGVSMSKSWKKCKKAYAAGSLKDCLWSSTVGCRAYHKLFPPVLLLSQVFYVTSQKSYSAKSYVCQNSNKQSLFKFR